MRPINRLALATLFLASLSLVACGGKSQPAPEECIPHLPMDAGMPLLQTSVRFVAGGQTLQPAAQARLFGTTAFSLTKARFYVSEPALITASGERVRAELVGSQGERLKYGVALIDIDRPASMALKLRAPAGEYKAMALSIGVPGRCESGETLNHSDASAMQAPLDVDSDMYWSWNPGYVFLKFEGLLEREGFFFHVGADERFAKLELQQAFTVTAQGNDALELVADFDRLLTSPTGEARPDVNDSRQRKVHGGEGADALVENIRGSGFLRLQPAQR